MTPKHDTDFEEFMTAPELLPGPELDSYILSHIKADLEVNHTIIFLKLLGIQAFIGIITMLFCPQFNTSLTGNYDLFHFFHKTFGYYGCSVACGALFIGTGAIFASYILRGTEVTAIRNSRFLYHSAITGIAALTFLIVGSEVYLSALSLWFIGAIISSISLFEVNYIIRQKI